MSYKDIYQHWLDAGIMETELASLSEEQIKECFYKELKFGTGGIRAIMGPGINRLNIYTVRKAAEGYARHVTDNNGKSVIITYDNRRNSKLFGEEAAKVLSSHGVTVLIFNSIKPTPELSFAVRYLHTFGGIVITASHNPSEYNGYKIYDSCGCQAVPRITDEIKKSIDGVGDPLEVHYEADDSLIHSVPSDVDEVYYRLLETVQERHGLDKNIKIVYTPLHGTGYIPVTTMLRRLGYEVFEVSEQCEPDPDFSCTDSPNPEDKRAFIKAVEVAKTVDADLILVTDPDCDRVGVAVKDKDDTYQYLTGNHTGAILLKYIIEAKEEKGTMPENPIVFDTIVTSDLGKRICEKHGIEVESTLTGFKYIGDKIREYEGKKKFLFGYEESYGYMIKDFTRDKDGVQGSILISEAVQYYKNNGMTLTDVLEQIYEEVGRCTDIAESVEYPGIDGIEKMNAVVEEYRQYEPGDAVEEYSRIIKAVEDYNKGIRKTDTGEETINLPKSNVVKIIFTDESWFVIRPSGNEPKIKRYACLWEHN